MLQTTHDAPHCSTDNNSRRLNREAASHAHGTYEALAIRSDLIWKPMENVTWITLEMSILRF
jgi:hypothetical protein